MTKKLNEKIKKQKWWKSNSIEVLHQTKEGDIVCNDALSFLNSLKENCADIVFLDPPFNLGKKYGRGKSTDRKHAEDYFDYMQKVIKRSTAILKPGGALYLYHIPKWAIKFVSLLDERLTFRHWIAVSMKNGFVRGNWLYPAHYVLLYFTKGVPARFKRPKILPAKCRHCNKYIKDYGGYKKYVENGINLSDFWDDLSPVRHKKHKHRKANELPQLILDRIVEISGEKRGVLVDPFVGTGTSLTASREKGMKFIACDIEKKYCNLSLERLSSKKS